MTDTAPASEGDASFKRVAIVNRGEAAVRLIRAVRELNLEHGFGMRTIATRVKLASPSDAGAVSVTSGTIR